VRAGRAAFAAIVVAGLVAGWRAELLAQSAQPPAGESGAAQPAGGGAKPPGAEGGAPKPAEGGAQQSPGEGGAQKPADGGAQKPAEGGSTQKPGDGGVPKSRYASILGRDLTNRDGDGGRVIDVLVDHEGRLSAVVIEFGGFMGIGSRKVAVDWNALRFLREGSKILLTVDIGRDQVRDSPEYKPNEPPTILTTK
jgi:hypothetical protein